MNEEDKIRKLPRITKSIFVILTVFAIIFFFMQEYTKNLKASEILYTLGYIDISDIKVYSKKKVEDKKTKIQGTRYFVIFKNNITNKECKGFILKDFKRKTAHDLSCK